MTNTGVEHTVCCFWKQKFQTYVFTNDEHSENPIKNRHLSLNILKKNNIFFWKNLSKTWKVKAITGMQHVLTIFVCPAENLKRRRIDISWA